MPELPEVESVRKVLENSLLHQKLNRYKITDKRINRFNVLNPKNIGVLNDIIRKGKILQFKFENISSSSPDRISNVIFNFFKSRLKFSKALETHHF